MTTSFTSIPDTAKEIENLFGSEKYMLPDNPTEGSAKLSEVPGRLSLMPEFILIETWEFFSHPRQWDI